MGKVARFRKIGNCYYLKLLDTNQTNCYLSLIHAMQSKDRVCDDLLYSIKPYTEGKNTLEIKHTGQLPGVQCYIPPRSVKAKPNSWNEEQSSWWHPVRQGRRSELHTEQLIGLNSAGLPV